MEARKSSIVGGRLQRAYAGQRGRLTVVGVLVIYFAVLAAVGGQRHWSRLGVPAGARRFEDLRNVTSAWDCARRGIAVLPVNPCDPGKSPANYPRLWLLPWHLGLGQGDTFALGLLVAAVFLVAAVAVVPTGAGVCDGLLFALALCSPAAMLGVERGNVDVTIFALVAIAALVAARLPSVSGAFVLFAAMLKLFPVFAVGLLVRRLDRPRLIAAAAVSLLFLGYVALTWSDVSAILHDYPQSDRLSFGVRRVSEWTSSFAGAHVSSSFVAYRAWDIVLSLGAIGCGIAVGLRMRGRYERGQGAARELDLFWAGACVYAGCYVLVRGYDYRLVFLLLTVPQLTRWLRERRPLAIVTLVALLFALWFDEGTGMPGVRTVLNGWAHVTRTGSGAQELPVAVIAQLVLFGSLIALLVATAPAGLRHVGRARATNAKTDGILRG